MPFIPQNDREAINKGAKLPSAVGEFCFLQYQDLMKEWNKSPRWTTIHNEAAKAFGTSLSQTARILAFLEFYFNHGHDYEIKKKTENGDIL